MYMSPCQNFMFMIIHDSEVSTLNHTMHADHGPHPTTRVMAG